MRYLIIGNGVAALGAIEGIRQYDQKGEIAVVSEEDLTTYGRPLISYVLGGKAKSDKLELKPQEYYAQMGVTTHLGTRIDCLDLSAKEAVAENGQRFAFDKALVATGGVPSRPSIPGLEGEGVHTFTNWAQAEGVEDALAAKCKRVAIIGAGLIALKAAEGLVMRGVQVSCIVRSRILRVYFDETASQMVCDHLTEKDIDFRHGASTQQIVRDADGKVTGVQTDQGVVECDAVILAAGVAPNTNLAQCAGLTVNHGIVVNDHMQASHPDVFAAGDVAEAGEILSGERKVIPIWPNAYNQGVNAGINMAGANSAYPGGLSMNATSFLGLPTISVGVVDPKEGEGYETVEELDAAAKRYRKLVFRKEDGADRLEGFILIGDVSGAGLYTGFIKHKLALTEDAKSEVAQGRPSPLFWPEDFFAVDGSVRQAETA